MISQLVGKPNYSMTLGRVWWLEMLFLGLKFHSRKRGNDCQAAWYDQEGKACDRLIGETAETIDLAFAANATDSQIIRTRHPKLCVEYKPNAIGLQKQRPDWPRAYLPQPCRSLV